MNFWLIIYCIFTTEEVGLFELESRNILFLKKAYVTMIKCLEN